MWGDVAIAFLLAFIVAFMATPYTIKIAHKIGAVDVPKDERRMHKKAMPKVWWASSNFRLFSGSNIFNNCNEHGKHNQLVGTRQIWNEIVGNADRNYYT